MEGPGAYIPSEEEVKKAEEMMTEKQAIQSEARAEGFGLGDEQGRRSEAFSGELKETEEAFRGLVFSQGDEIDLDKAIHMSERLVELREELHKMFPNAGFDNQESLNVVRESLAYRLLKAKRFDDAIKIAEVTGYERLNKYAREAKESAGV